jgi:inhibitor of cysteine peptidase
MSGGAGASCAVFNDHTYLAARYLTENFPLRAHYDADRGLVILSSVTENPVTVTTMKLNSKDENLTVTLQYPQIRGLDDLDVQDSINSVLRGAATAAVGEGLSNSFELTQTKLDYPDHTFACDTYLDYRVTYNQDGLLCVTMTDYQYAGGAHGTTVQTSYLFDLRTGDRLDLSDLMNSGAAYLSVIDPAIRAEIDRYEAAGELVELDSGRFKTIGDHPNFYPTDDALVFYFQQYEYFPYAAGIQEFSIPYGDLAGLLNSGWALSSAETVTLEPSLLTTIPDGGTACVDLSGNPTTGYMWHCEIGDEGVLALLAITQTPDSDLIGAGSSFSYLFQALKPGKTTVTFTYYRDWEDPSSATAENTIVYQVLVP